MKLIVLDRLIALKELPAHEKVLQVRVASLGFFPIYFCQCITLVIKSELFLFFFFFFYSNKYFYIIINVYILIFIKKRKNICLKQFLLSEAYLFFCLNFCDRKINCSERNHARGSSKCARICLVCKKRSRREKQAIGEIELTSSWSWIVFDVSAHVNYHIMQLTRMWHFGMITQVQPECTGGSNGRQRMTRDELGYRTVGEDCWGRKRNIYQEIRTAAEAHRQTWLYMKDYIKPGYLQNHKKKLIPRVLFVAEEAYRPPSLFFQTGFIAEI